MERFAKNPDLPMEYTQMGDRETNPLGSFFPFRDVPKYAEALSVICRLLGYEK